MSSMRTLRAGEMFAGYGGLALAVSSVFDASTAWLCEVDKYASKVLEHRFPEVPNLGDVTAVDWGSVEPVDIIAGGSPCQDVSVAGGRAGMSEGTRSNLWVAMRDAISIIKPSFVVWENVRGALSAKADTNLESCPGCVGDTGRAREPFLRALGRVLGDLSELRYDAQWRVVSASEVGAAHRRERVFVLAHRRDLFTVSQNTVEDTDTPKTGETVNHLLAPPTAHDNKGACLLEKHHARLKQRNRTQMGNLQEDITHLMPTPNTLDYLGYREGEKREKALRRGVEGGSLRASTGNLREEVHFNADLYLPAVHRWEKILGRKSPRWTIIGDNGKPKLNPMFSEWLMGLPEGWVSSPEIGLSYGRQLMILGNGVVPQQAEAALTSMLENIIEKE